MQALDDVYKMAEALGLVVDNFTLDGLWHSVKATNGKKTKKSGTYCLSELTLKSGQVVVVGMLFNWLTGQEERLTLDDIINDDVTAEDLAEAKRRARQAAEEGKKAKKQLQLETAERAKKAWDKLPEGGKSDYLFRKKVKPHGIRFARGKIVVPARDINGKLWTLQWIDGDGNKIFMTGGAMRGQFHLIGLPQGEQPSLIAVAEGYATAASIHEAKGWPIAVAFNAGNLLPVVGVLRAAYPSACIVVCSDHDIYNGYEQAFIKEKDITPAVRDLIERLKQVRPDVLVEFVTDDDPRTRDREKSHNVGLAAAILAAAKVDGVVLVPRF
jgi:putative DNA primase/helicase